MALIEDVKGQYVDLRCATLDDAEFTLAIRQDPEFVKYLPKIENTLEQQKSWLAKQRIKNGDYFFVVWSKDNQRLGTISIFDLDNDPKSGRLALRGNALQNMEAQYLLFKLAFVDMKIEKLWGFIYVENQRAIRFAQAFGVTLFDPEIDETGRNIHEVIFERQNFIDRKAGVEKMIYRKKTAGGKP